MAERFKSDRAIFRKGKQQTYLTHTKEKLNLTHADMARLLRVSERTVSDWQREKFSMSMQAVSILAKQLREPEPIIQRKNRYWYVNKAAPLGGRAVYKKYGVVGGDSEQRKRRWHEWWEKKGKYESSSILNRPLSIEEPKRSRDLAEFIGIMLGDGGISARQVTVTLHHRDDKVYSQFVVRLIHRLFGIKPRVYLDVKDSVNRITVSRTELVRFCNQKLGLVIGNKIKQQIDVPAWIWIQKEFQIACVRGLIDTDGSVFIHHYKVGGKWYRYKKLSFTSLSRPLALSVTRILKSLGLKPGLSRNKDVRLNDIEDVRRYFLLVGSHNQKHLNRYRK